MNKVITFNLPKKIKANSSDIFFGLGIASSLFAVGMAAYQGHKIRQDIDDHKDKILDLDVVYEDGDKPKETKLSITSKTVFKVTGRLASFLVPEAASIFCFGKCKSIQAAKLKKSQAAYVALAGAYGQTVEHFSRYRQNVVDRYGAEVDAELYTSAVKMPIEYETVDEETGEIKKVKKKAMVAQDQLTDADISFFFDSTSRNWESNPWENKQFIMQAEMDLTTKLIRQGYLFLNDIRKYFDMPETVAGQLNMLIYDPEHPENHQNRVYLGVFHNEDRKNDDALMRFLDGYESVVLICPKMDGVRIEEAMEKGLISEY